MNIGECNVPGDTCPWENCDACQVGRNWLMEQLEIIEIKKDIYEAAQIRYKKAFVLYGEHDRRTRKAWFEMAAAHRDVPEELKPGKQCPGCARIITTKPNFCGTCGKAILYK